MDRDALLTTTCAEFLNAFLLAIDRILPQSATALIRAAEASDSPAVQVQLFAAYTLLMEGHDSLHQHMMQSMDQLLERSVETTYSTFRPSFLSRYPGHELTLLETTDHEDQLRIDDITARFRHAADSQLRDLNMRIAILFDQDSINERENPFRPYLFYRATSMAIAAFAPPAELCDTLLDQLASDLRNEITTIYDAANTHLAWHGIAARLQLRIVKSGLPGDTRTGDDGPDTPSSSNNAPDASRSSPAPTEIPLTGKPARTRADLLLDHVRGISAETLTPHALHQPVPTAASWLVTQDAFDSLTRLFAGTQGIMLEGQPAAPTSLATAARRRIGKPLAAMLSTLIEHAAADTASMTASDGKVRNLVIEQRAALNGTTDNTSEQMTIDVVAMLFEYMLRDPLIPVDTRIQLGRLQFVMLKAALRETALLTHKQHPARLLMNRMASVSARLAGINPDAIAGHTVGAEICRIVDLLLADRSDQSDIVDALLANFERIIAAELRGSGTPIDVVASSLEQARSRTLRFTRLSGQLCDALSGLNIDPFLHHFLDTTWVRVIERSERNQERASLRFRHLVPDLLWSIRPKSTPEERSQLIDMLSRLVSTLREGMTLDKLDVTRQQEVLNWLVDAHSRAMRPGGQGAITLEAIRQHFRKFLSDVDKSGMANAAGETPPLLASDPHFGAFLAEALAESSVQLQQLDPLIDSTIANGVPGTTHSPISDNDVILHLRAGVAINLTLGATVLTGYLGWIDADASVLVFQLDNDPVPALLGMPSFLHLKELDRVHFYEPVPAFERAMQSLMAAAQAMDTSGAVD